MSVQRIRIDDVLEICIQSLIIIINLWINNHRNLDKITRDFDEILKSIKFSGEKNEEMGDFNGSFNKFGCNIL